MKHILTSVILILLSFGSIAQPCDFQFYTNEISPQQGQVDTLMISIIGFQDVQSFQGALQYDQSLFEYVGHQFSNDITSDANFGLSNATEGYFSFLWASDPQTLPDHNSVIEIYIRGLAETSETACNFAFVDYTNILLEVVAINNVHLSLCTDCSELLTSKTTDITASSAFEITLSPNPTSGWISIASNGYYDSITITTSTGKEIKTIPFSTQIDLSGLPSGVYLLNFFQDNARTVKRCIIN